MILEQACELCYLGLCSLGSYVDSDSISVKFSMSSISSLLKCCCVPGPKSCSTGSSKGGAQPFQVSVLLVEG